MPCVPESSVERILVIDDNTNIHSDFQKILAPRLRESPEFGETALALLGESEADSACSKAPEFQLDFAEQGQMGLKKVIESLKKGSPYSIVFCDMRMPPGWDGIETIERIWAVDPKLQIVICSAYSDTGWPEISERLGHSDQLLILKKPFDSAEILQLAISLTEKRRLLSSAFQKQEQLEAIVYKQNESLEVAHKEADLLLSAINSLMVGIDQQGTILRWNQTAVEIFEVPEQEAVGNKFAALPIQWDDALSVKELSSHTLQRSCRSEASFINSNGEKRIIGFSKYPVLDESEVKGTLILGSDLTEHRAMEQHLQTAQKLESVGQLAAGVAHEINTPMQYLGDNLCYVNTKFEKLAEFLSDVEVLIDRAECENFEHELVNDIRAKAKALRLDKLRRQIPEALSDSIDGVQHVSRIVQAMKELSHPGGDEKTAVDINRILETTKTVATNEWKYVADITMQLAKDLPVIPGLPGELNQVFLNLIVNASHAISDQIMAGKYERGQITIRSLLQQDTIRVEISDTGGGIPVNIRKKVFDPFFTTKSVGQGTGQGLAISYTAITQKHSGRISLDVDEGQGTTFIVELPLTEPKQNLPAVVAVSHDVAITS